MAINNIGFQKTVNESGSAWRFSNAMVNFKVEGPGHLRVSPVRTRIRGIEVSQGTASVLGVLIDVTATTPLTIAPNGSNRTRLDTVVLRVQWGNGKGGSSAILTVLPGSSGQLATPDNNPGTAVDCPLAIVEVAPGATQFTAAHVRNIAPWGTSSELTIAGDHPTGMRLPPGSRVVCAANGDLWQAQTNPREFKPLRRQTSPWVSFDPQIASDAGRVYLGNGGVSHGRYKIIAGMVYGEFELRSGTDAYNWGHGALRFRLPHAPGSANSHQDQWFKAHAYTVAGGEPMDWPVQMIFARGNRDAFLFAPRSANDCRISHMSAADSAARTPGTGTPRIDGAVSDFSVVAGTFRYPV